jgi:hypothetical protein
MAKVDVKTEVQAPDEIRINLVREDFLDTSNIFRIFFEITLAIAGTVLGCVISILSNNNKVPFMTWFFLILMILACIAFLVLSIRHYNLAKCQTTK